LYLIGYDVGSSSVKAVALDASTGKVFASATSPKKEMPIDAPQPGWAEQHPQMWWDNLKIATAEILQTGNIKAADIKAIGISYQMHGLVIVDKNKNVLRPAIIWCDSRAVDIGNRAAKKIGVKKCLTHLLNSPGNFTASKLKWVRDNEPDVYGKIYKAMLPGDYIAMRMTDRAVTTISGLSEGIMWDFRSQQPSDIVLNNYGISPALICEIMPTFSIQGELMPTAAAELGLKRGTVVSYRAGDQPNNALSLNVLNPGEIAATAGTSGVVYGVGNSANYDPKSRVNTFAHVNYTRENPRYGVLMCLNGTGILNSWLKHNISGNLDYPQINEFAAGVPTGCDGLVVLPYGNGAERTLKNENIGAQIHNLNFNIHTRSHIFRAAQEGIAFALNYGVEIMRGMGLEVNTIRAGHANTFLSPVFSQAFAAVTQARVELYNTDGAQGAARGAGIGTGMYKNYAQAFTGLTAIKVIEPERALIPAYEQAYQNWRAVLENQLTAQNNEPQ
jgi:xylulokinase